MPPDQNTIEFVDPGALNDAGAALVDVRTPEAHGECRIPGSVNLCVYVVDFVKNFPEAFPDREARIVVYGDGAPFKADLAAVGRLRMLGYTGVAVLEGGLSRWIAEGRPTEGPGASPAPAPSGKFTLDASATQVRWIGRNLTNQHDGTVEATDGFIELDADGRPTAGRVVVDLRRMRCRDIVDTSLAGVLIGHLQNADFFDVENFPTASFELLSAEPIPGATPGQPQYRAQGRLSARGKSVPLNLNALVEPAGDGLVFQANFDFDRVALGAVYGSGSLFERLGMHLVNDLVSIDVRARFR